MSEDDDERRLQHQARWLRGLTWHVSDWHPANPANDHDHCELCSVKFAAEGAVDALHRGYATGDRERWVCAECFAAHRVRFEWRVREVLNT